jgi:predicted ATPase
VKRFVLTGAPGAGKTAILRLLELEGFSVVEEAATDVILLEQARGVAEPWKQVSFLDSVAELQRLRVCRASLALDEIQFHDRSAICTVALAHYLGFPISETLSDEVERVKQESTFEPFVFLIRNLGFITRTEARRISFEEALRFERIHEETYRSFGFEVVSVEPGNLVDRMLAIKRSILNIDPAGLTGRGLAGR